MKPSQTLKRDMRVEVPYRPAPGQIVDPGAIRTRTARVKKVGATGAQVVYDDDGSEEWVHGFRLRVVTAATPEAPARVEIDHRKPKPVEARPVQPAVVSVPQPASAAGEPVAEIDAWLALGAEMLPRLEAGLQALGEEATYLHEALQTVTRERELLSKRIELLRSIAGAS